jgi:hypothetical protein
MRDLKFLLVGSIAFGPSTASPSCLPLCHEPRTAIRTCQLCGDERQARRNEPPWTAPWSCGVREHCFIPRGGIALSTRSCATCGGSWDRTARPRSRMTPHQEAGDHPRIARSRETAFHETGSYRGLLGLMATAANRGRVVANNRHRSGNYLLNRQAVSSMRSFHSNEWLRPMGAYKLYK